MQKKSKPKPPAKATTKPKPAPVAVPAPKPEPVATAPTTPAPASTPATVKSRPSARTRRATASPAARRGSDLVRYLRIHAKKPYGARGENALVALAKEVGHLGNIELGDVATVVEPT